MRKGNRLGKLAILIAFAIVVNRTPAFAGDRIAELTEMLSSSSEKTRMSAVLSLARLGDKRALKPLVTALHDPNAHVRAIAATALGKLGHKAALPALKSTSVDDLDETVRTKAHEAAVHVAKRDLVRDEELEPAAEAQARAEEAAGFGRSPHAVADAPDLYVTIKGSNDDSPGKTDKTTRKLHADIVKTAL